ncbi:MAG: GIN domain-containing protein [Candidatus Promineifilaceae bacterium]
MILQQAILAHSDRPEVGFAFDVTVRQADDFSVITSVDDNLADYLVLATEGRTLHIGLRPSFAYDIPAATMRAEVVMPRLAGLAMSQSSHVTLMGLDAPNSFAAELSGSSAFGGSLETNAATFSLSGSTLARLSGASQRVTIGICGNSVIDLRSFQVEDAEVEASCSSTVLFNLNGKLIADASQFAQVTYRGNPDLGGVETAESAMVIPE